MARFRFRLEASLHLAQQALEMAERTFAEEVRRFQACVEACRHQQVLLKEAFEGQREAGLHKPEELGQWQLYVLEQRRRMQLYEQRRLEQEAVMEKARQSLLEAHREKEKFERLKEKQAKAFIMAEQQKEQKLLDETGQALYWRQQR